MKTKESFKRINIDEWSSDEADEWMEWMLTFIGDPDPELRDECIYPAFGRLIQEGRLHKDQVDKILETCLSESHLFYRIGEQKGDGVFTRSFSALVIAEVVHSDQGWKRERYEQILNAVGEYLKEEQDMRGYVQGKGWAHSMAHGADLLVALVEHTQFRQKDANLFLQAVQNAFWKEYAFTDDEEERLAFVIEALLQKGVAPSIITKWVKETFVKLDAEWNARPFAIPVFRIRTNVLHFMKALFFRVEVSELQGMIKQYLEEWHKRVYQH
ncbi:MULTISPECIES: DUF2785 domain-containing protein [Pontibacillus]|uniref:DUF2785 domain-containing protein n=1 Tax=Pontibacillus chungwhensis TaxID=265426 RepID=A0ABY8UYG4_9BACI|nr:MULTISPECIES: DUF2785 domain-containing protein [Pontibacillus]MCD5323320.1 DUF2785 domain-containing protein [Pontibacillus sp. HN14]WIF96701.1 DUF2785 domain-containing protein [Pontibacillus chungwhensis]